MLSTRLKKIKNNKFLIAIIIIAILLRFVGLWPNTINADEAYVQTKSWDVILNVVKFHDINPHTFKYGSLMFYLQALIAVPTIIGNYFLNMAHLLPKFDPKWLDFSYYFDEATRKYANTLVAHGRAETAFFGVATVVVVYFLAKKLFNKRVGLLSAFLFAIAPLHVRDSHYITTDILSLFAIMLALLCMAYLMDTKKWKWFILSGITLGISATIRYFPLALLAYPIAILFSFEKKWVWFLKVMVSGIFIFVGVFLGMPFFFLDPKGPALFMEDMQKYVLPWYSTSISTYIFSTIISLTSHGKAAMPDIKMLYSTPRIIRPIHANWLFFNGIDILPTLTGLAGMVILLFKSLRKFLFLMVIPVVNFIYISAFIPAYYERLVIPLIPFMAIFAGVFIDFIFVKFEKSFNKKRVVIILALFVLLVAFLPLTKSFSSSIACGEDSIQTQSVDWILKHNIPQVARIGYLTPVSTPPVTYAVWKDLEPQ